MNVCAHCNKNLALLDEIHTVDGQLFCSKECAIEYLMNDIIMNAKESAIEAYGDTAEVVSPVDIGIVFEKTWTAYDNTSDVTTIFLSRYLDEECTETILTEVAGFYFGPPTTEDTEKYTGIFMEKY